ncbi:MAG: DUF1697 domain-containing protein [Actinobacteria bacterium]|nr:DUF1697 domain-containing protein [Actinomycetota bacterium]
MDTWVALLRGVNVNGITIRSADLTAVFTGLGFASVKTILASGNVRFETHEDPAGRERVKTTIEESLRTRFGYDAWIVLASLAEVQAAVDAFPFDANDARRQPYVVFGSDQTVLDGIAESVASLDPEVDPVARGNAVLYWNPVKGTTVDTPFGRMLGRAAYRQTTTTRNLRTLLKILGPSAATLADRA